MPPEIRKAMAKGLGALVLGAALLIFGARDVLGNPYEPPVIEDFGGVSVVNSMDADRTIAWLMVDAVDWAQPKFRLWVEISDPTAPDSVVRPQLALPSTLAASIDQCEGYERVESVAKDELLEAHRVSFDEFRTSDPSQVPNGRQDSTQYRVYHLNVDLKERQASATDLDEAEAELDKYLMAYFECSFIGPAFVAESESHKVGQVPRIAVAQASAAQPSSVAAYSRLVTRTSSSTVYEAGFMEPEILTEQDLSFAGFEQGTYYQWQKYTRANGADRAALNESQQVRMLDLDFDRRAGHRQLLSGIVAGLGLALLVSVGSKAFDVAWWHFRERA